MELLEAMYFGIVGLRQSIGVKYVENEKIGSSIHGRGDFCFGLCDVWYIVNQ
jgi:hypothetical protein